MDALQSIGVFAAQTFLIFFALVAIILIIAILAGRVGNKVELDVELIHRKYKRFGQILKSYTLSKVDRKQFKKHLKQESKRQQELEAHADRKIYLIDFEGDVKASAVDNLREEISAVLAAATDKDEVIVRVESPGGVVHGYGLAASQLLRVRNRGLRLTVCVDKVAASGGYMMACTAHQILAAPFAIVGSIGVVAQVPNFHKTLKRYDVDYKEYTAGDYKRTVSLLGEITPKGEEKFKEQLEDTHLLFKSFVHKLRPQIDIDKIATGEYWYGEQALQKGLVDVIRTSDDYLMELSEKYQIVKVEFKQHESIGDKLTGIIGKALKQGGSGILAELENRRYL